VKLGQNVELSGVLMASFSILERIDVGETVYSTTIVPFCQSFRSSNGSTWVKLFPLFPNAIGKISFSILERIDVGETYVIVH